MRVSNVGVILALVFLSTLVVAQGVEEVILATTKNYPDAFVASVAGEKAAEPVILVDYEKLSSDVIATIESFSPERIVIVGGYAVISKEQEEELENMGYEIVRLWGMTRYGTSNEVATYFWPEGSEKAILVQDNLESKSNDILAEVKELAKDEEAPILLIPGKHVPADTLSTLKDLGVKKVWIYADLSQESLNELEALEIEIEEIVNLSNAKKLKRMIRNKIRIKLNKSDMLIVVAAANFTHLIMAPNLPQARAFIVSSPDEIQDVIDAINERNITQVKILGKPDLAKQIAQEIEANTNAEIELISGEKARDIANNLTKKFKEKFMERFREKVKVKLQLQFKFKERLSKLAKQMLEKARNLTENASQSIKKEVEECEKLCEAENYSKCFKKCLKVVLKVKINEHASLIAENASKIKELVLEEVKTLHEKIQELIAINKEFAEEIKGKKSVEERLEIIEKYREEKLEKIKEIRETAKGIKEKVKEAVEEIKEEAKKKQKEKESAQTTIPTTTTLETMPGPHHGHGTRR